VTWLNWAASIAMISALVVAALERRVLYRRLKGPITLRPNDHLKVEFLLEAPGGGWRMKVPATVTVASVVVEGRADLPGSALDALGDDLGLRDLGASGVHAEASLGVLCGAPRFEAGSRRP